MTPDEEQRIADAVAGALIGHMKPMKARWITKGDVFRDIRFVVLPDPKSFDDYECASVDLVAHKTGWLHGIRYIGAEPVGLEIT